MRGGEGRREEAGGSLGGAGGAWGVGLGVIDCFITGVYYVANLELSQDV